MSSVRAAALLHGDDARRLEESPEDDDDSKKLRPETRSCKGIGSFLFRLKAVHLVVSCTRVCFQRLLQKPKAKETTAGVPTAPATYGQIRNNFSTWYPPVLLLCVAMCLHADQNLAAPNLSAIAEEFELSSIDKDAKLGGQVQLGFFFVGGATSLAMGPLADRMNRINLLFWVVLLGSFPCLLIRLVPSGPGGFFWYLCSRVVTGISVGGSFPLLYSLVGDLAGKGQRAMISAAMGVATAVGVACGQLLAGFLGPRFGWRFPFILVAYPAIAVATLLRVTVAEPRQEQWKREARARIEKEERKKERSEAEGSLEDGEVSGMLEGHETSPKIGDQRTAIKKDRDSNSRCTEPEAKCDDEKEEVEEEQDDDIGHGAMPADCKRFQRVCKGTTNKLLLCQGFPGCVSWSTVTTFMPDYLHTNQGLCVESATMVVSVFGVSCLAFAFIGAAFGQRIYSRNKNNLAYLMSICAALAVIPFLVLINSSPDSLRGPQRSAGKEPLPSLWAFSLAVAGGVAAVAAPNMKGLLMNINTPDTRGTVFALVTLTDDVGKGLGPEVVALGVVVLGRRLALSCAMACWLVCSALLYCTKYTIAKDVQRVELIQKKQLQV